MDRLGRAYAIAATAHDGQVDKAGVSYFEHPLSVCRRVSHLGESAKIVAILHDVQEDCETDHLDLSFLTVEEQYALDCLTKRKDESYLNDYLNRVLTSPLAIRVKIADLCDNLDGTRMPDVPLTDRDLRRQEKYRRALSICRSALKSHGPFEGWCGG